MSNIQDENLEEVVSGLDLDMTKIIRDNDLDIAQAGREAVANLARYRANRKDMKRQIDALENAIKRIDKRIEMALETLRIVGTPT